MQAHIKKSVMAELIGPNFFHHTFMIDWNIFNNQPPQYQGSPIPEIDKFFGDKLFVAMLNHNFNELCVRPYYIGGTQWGEPSGNDAVIQGDAENPLEINWPMSTNVIPEDGWSLVHLETEGMEEYIMSIYPAMSNLFQGDGVDNRWLRLGAWVVGHYFDMDHAVNLEVEQGYEYEGHKGNVTIGGASVVNINYSKPPNWGVGFGGNAGVTNMGFSEWSYAEHGMTGDTINPNNPLDPLRRTLASQLHHGRNGRRFWRLKFSMYGRDNIFPEYSLISTIGGKDADGNDLEDGYGFEADDSFYSKVIQRTLGGALPFLFCPDKDNPNPDTFAVCRFDQEEFSFKQTAPSIWEFELRIVEAW